MKIIKNKTSLNAVCYKITSIASSFAKWKLTWAYRPQKCLTMGHFNWW